MCHSLVLGLHTVYFIGQPVLTAMCKQSSASVKPIRYISMSGQTAFLQLLSHPVLVLLIPTTCQYVTHV